MSEIEEILEAQHKYFYTGETKKLAFRIDMLKRLEEAVIRHEKELLLALQKDLAKAPFEGYETEVGIVRRELADTIAHLKQWDKPKRVGTPIVHFRLSAQFTENLMAAYLLCHRGIIRCS